ncbi:unnamed protein product [Moneuplotes crassus]|uniref:Uncharacterized protein n=1 Tax=Euplotes crassus TaxID=5936 RepID=A0AAD1Y009_EUPCR|nr:unnamed protein product [Moneuplotes crassus]
MKEACEKMHKLVNSKEYMILLYLISFAIIFGLLIWRMIVGGTSALLIYLFVNCNLTLGALVHFIVLWIMTDEEHEDKLCSEEAKTFFYITAAISGLVFGPAYLMIVFNNDEDYNSEIPFCSSGNCDIVALRVLCSFCICQLGLGIALPIVYDQQMNAGFWVGLMFITYLELFCYSVYLQTRYYLFKVHWLPYVHPLTWIFYVCFLIF